MLNLRRQGVCDYLSSEPLYFQGRNRFHLRYLPSFTYTFDWSFLGWLRLDWPGKDNASVFLTYVC